MITRNYIILLAWFLIAACNSSKKNTAHNVLVAKDLLPYGRTAITDNKLELISSAVHFGFSFQGNACDVYASLPQGMDYNYLQYELDGVYQKRIKVSKEQSPLHLTAPGNGQHTIWIYKATEATTGPVYIEKITGNKLNALQNSNAPLIEFIGNSITCGADADTSEMPCGVGQYHDYHNAYYAYGPRVARMLGANYILSSVSGIGIYRTWNHEEPSMPQVYEKTSLQVNDTRDWDFNQYHPKIVSVALGTNDLSNGDGKTPRSPFDSAKFVNNYIGFVQLVKTKYPGAQIVFLNSPMVSGERNVLLENCLQTIKMHIDHLDPADNPVALFHFKPMKAGGCAGHPSVKDHAVLADELYPFFNGLLAK
jgi:lysophospholipase L1-like esterase